MRRVGLERDGVRLSALRGGGDGVPVLLLHGLAGSAAEMAPLAAELGAHGHRVVVVDQRGHGHSTRRPADVSRAADVESMVAAAVDRFGTLYEGRDQTNAEKDAIARVTNRDKVHGGLAEALRGRDVFIGLSGPNLVTPAMVRGMGPRPIVFALANPTPEIPPEAALEAGAAVVATGRSDYQNQINNAIAFPGIFRGALDVAARNINDAMEIAAAHALADLVPDYELSPSYILPKALDFRGAPEVAAAVARAAIETGEARRRVDPRLILENTRDYLYGGTLRALPGEPIPRRSDPADEPRRGDATELRGGPPKRRSGPTERNP